MTAHMQTVSTSSLEAEGALRKLPVCSGKCKLQTSEFILVITVLCDRHFPFSGSINDTTSPSKVDVVTCTSQTRRLRLTGVK